MERAKQTSPPFAGMLRATGLVDLVGNTPLIRLERLEAELGHVQILGKAEWFNPGGSVKDRPALRMITEGERSGLLRPGMTILDATSGNTGIAYAWIGAAKGYRVRLVVPSNANAARKRLLRALGADVVYTDPGEGIDAAIAKAREIHSSAPSRYFYPDQYGNPANWMSHHDTTAVEIWRDTRGVVTHFVAGLGTTGTFVGCARRLLTMNPDIECVSVEPDEPFHGLEGLKHMESSSAPDIYDPTLATLRTRVRTEDAYAMVTRLAREEGLVVGPSAGAALRAAVDLAGTVPSRRPAVIVAILPDGGERYADERFWDEPGQGAGRAEA